MVPQVRHALRFGVISFFLSVSFANSQEPSIQGDMRDVQSYFILRGNKIHPSIIRNLWKDREATEPTKTEIDLLKEQAKRIKEGEKYEVQREWVSVPYRDKDNFREYGSFGYSVRGTLPNGDFVLEVSNNNGGSYSSHHILVLKLDQAAAIKLKKIDQVDLVGCESIEISANEIKLGACENIKVGKAEQRVLRY